MVKIRLTRLGRHKSPFYRLVAIDSKTKRDGGYLQLLGTYNPQKNEVNLKTDLILTYLRNGAQPSDTALALLKDKGIWKSFCDTKVKKAKKNKRPSKSKKTKKENKQEAKKTEPANPST